MLEPLKQSTMLVLSCPGHPFDVNYELVAASTQFVVCFNIEAAAAGKWNVKWNEMCPENVKTKYHQVIIPEIDNATEGTNYFKIMISFGINLRSHFFARPVFSCSSFGGNVCLCSRQLAAKFPTFSSSQDYKINN